MENSIEDIWKKGFLHKESLVIPKINDLYNQKSKHLVDILQSRWRFNLRIIIVTAIIFPVIYSLIGFIWQGVMASVMLLLTAWYSKTELRGIKKLDPGTTSLDYLRSFNAWLQNALSRSEKVARFSYPLYFLIALSTMWSAWEKGKVTSLTVLPVSKHLSILDNPRLLTFILMGVAILLMAVFAGRLYKWEVRLMYGCVLDKLKETIAEMENLSA